MASSLNDKTASIIALNGKNYPSWKVQCRMALMRDSVWGIVAKTEVSPDPNKAVLWQPSFCQLIRHCCTSLEIHKTLLWFERNWQINFKRKRGQTGWHCVVNYIHRG